MTEDKVIAETIAWIQSIVIDCHFCPFAAKAMADKVVHFVVLEEATEQPILTSLLEQLQYLNDTAEVETTFLILPNGFNDFHSYLALVASAEKLARRHHYEGIYQIASFHPDYCFAGSNTDDPANYTNRSIYPMLHILRESSITKALKHFPNPELIPQRNVDYARAKGLQYMQMLRNSCLLG
ncbi:MAG: DUF1415 domain-containing protein [Saprospiraceae bacterium]|nr:DUF1415 domain-containing protein [Saprospiraceae bacterium]